VEAKTVEEQTERAIRNCETILKTGGASLEDVVQVVVRSNETPRTSTR